jgi:predicted metal-binding membrane protein
MGSAAGPVRGARPSPAYAAVRAHLGLVTALCLLALGGWLWTAREMRGMDDGPFTELGRLTWFIAVWVVMMAAMMFPSVAPTIALYTRVTRASSPVAPWLFAGGYLLAWTAAGLVAYLVGQGLTSLFGDRLAWDAAGQALAGATLLVAAAYEVTPLKNVCLARCRTPIGALLTSWHGGPTGSLRMGARNGAWCVGCCWALMASLFALGVMSVSWMAFVAILIAAEKLLPQRRPVTLTVAAVLLGLGTLLLVAPGAVPGLTIPSGQPMKAMTD